MNYDQVALRHLLAGQPIPQSLIAESAAAVGDQCPDCGGGHVESNGRAEYRCVDCDHRWGFDGERYGF